MHVNSTYRGWALLGYFNHVIYTCMFFCCRFTGQKVVVPDALVEELADLRAAYATLLMRFERELERSSEAQEDFVAFLRKLLRGAISSDCDFHSALEILIDNEVSLFNIHYLKHASIVLPEEVR